MQRPRTPSTCFFHARIPFGFWLSVPVIGRLAGCAFRKGARRSALRFPNPASLPAPKPGFTFIRWS